MYIYGIRNNFTKIKFYVHTFMKGKVYLFYYKMTKLTLPSVVFLAGKWTRGKAHRNIYFEWG